MKLQRNILYLLATCPLLISHGSGAVIFDPSLLAGASREADLSRIYESSEMFVGIQEMDIYVNNHWKGRYDLFYGKQPDDISLSWTDAQLLGINITNIPAPAISNGQVQLRDIVQGGRIDIEASTLSVKLTIPQAVLFRTEAGYVSPQFWDEGLPALMLSYNMTYYNTYAKTMQKSNDDNFYTGLESGINLFGWQLRDSSNWRKSTENEGQWQSTARYLRRPITYLKSNLTMGDFYLPGDLFDAIRVRGVSLVSEMKMRPNSQQVFSPVIRGVTRTNALVEVIQNGNVIYQENIPPGQFTLDSILSTGSAGDLLVIVHEADGSQQSFTVPFSAVPGMLKEGVSQYSLVAGKLKQTTIDATPGFVQGSGRYGFNNLITGYTGAMMSGGYQAGLLGTAWNLPLGAISVDVTYAKTQLLKRRDSGQNYRITYSKFVDTMATNFTLAAYRYSTKGYYSFSDALYSQEGFHRLKRQYGEYKDKFGTHQKVTLNNWDALRLARPKNTFTLNLNQHLSNGRGTLSFAGSLRDYWASGQKTREYQLGYSNSLGHISYAFSANRVRNSDRGEETRFYVSLSLPFSMFDNNTWISSSLSANSSHHEQSNISLSGNALASNRLSYSLSGSDQRGGGNMASINTTYRANFSTLGASYSESSDYRQIGISSRGSMVAIPWRMLTSNGMGNTMTVVEAPEASGLMVNGDESIVTNKEGFALMTYATPYRKNAITLTETPASAGAEVQGNIANNVPFDGAVNYIRFETDRRQTWALRAVRDKNKPLPFGTEVFNEHNESVGFVGQASVLYIRAEQKPRQLNVQMHDGRCVITNPQFGLNKQSSFCL